jgi:putative FmdB family regulatory protein
MLYDYECTHCQHGLEDVYQKINDEPLKNCPSCGKDALMRIISGGAYAFVKNTNTIGGLADKNTQANKGKISEILHKEAESKPVESKPWYQKEGSANSSEINKMTKKQKAKYIMEGKK